MWIIMRMKICLWLKGLRQCRLIKSSFCFHHFKPVLLFSYHIPGKSYWSKDIIFLVTDKDQLGMQAWLDAYHGISNSCKYPRTLHELKAIISWFSRKCRVEGEKIIVGRPKKIRSKVAESRSHGLAYVGLGSIGGFLPTPRDVFILGALKIAFQFILSSQLMKFSHV